MAIKSVYKSSDTAQVALDSLSYSYLDRFFDMFPFGQQVPHRLESIERDGYGRCHLDDIGSETPAEHESV